MNQDIEEITLYFSEGKDLSGYDFQTSDWFNIWSALEGFPIASSFDNSSLHSIYDAVNSGSEPFNGENLDLFYIYEKAKGNEVLAPEFENESLKNLFNAWINGPQNVVLPEITGIAERGEILTCSTGTWSGEGTITYAFQWQRNGIDILGERNSTYTLAAADDNELISCEVSATDDQGTTRRSSNTVLSLGAPFNLVAPAITGVQQVGEVLNVSNGTWQGVEPITFDYAWKRDNVSIPGANSRNYTLVADDYNAVIKCVVIATNVYDSVDQDSNSTGAIAGIAPSISGVPTIAGTVQVLETLTATFASSSGLPTPTDSIKWQRSSDGVSGWADIPGETSLTYTIPLSDDNKFLRVVQTSTNAEGSDTANSASTVQVVGDAPTITGVPTFSGTENVGEDLTAVYASSSGVPTPTNSIQWQRSSDGISGWSDISGATSLVYTLVLADEGNYVRCVQTATNGLGSDTANSVASGEIQPEVTYVGVLDTYGGATAAYSIRLLSNSYTGALIRVRRSSDNAEKDFLPDANFEISLNSEAVVGGQTLGNFVGANDGFVTTWYDQSGNGNDATNAIASEQPKIISSGVLITEGGKPAVDFDGSDDVLLTSSTFSIAEVTALSVIKMNLSSAESYPLLVQSSNNTGFRQHLNDSYIRGRFSGTNIDDNGIAPDDVHALFTIINDGSVGSLFWNGQAEQSGSASLSVDPTAVLSIAGNTDVRPDTSDGVIQEIIMYPSDNSSNRVGIETNINDFYSIY